MRPMNELRPFYKLLSIPEDTATPTPFQLLGLPEAHTPGLTREQIEQALLERRKLLRQNIPGPQAFPIVSLIEQTMDRAAARLMKHLGLADARPIGQSEPNKGREGPSGPSSRPASPVEQQPRPVEHRPRAHSQPAAATPRPTETWQDALHWVITESRVLYEQARRQNDLSSAAEALRTYLTARRFLQIIDKE